MFLSYLTNFKWIITAIGAIASVCSIVWYIDDNGYQRAMIELQGAANEKIKEATNKAVIEAAKDMQKALDRQQLLHDEELSRTAMEQKVKTEIKKVIEYVDRVEIKNECAVTGDDVIRLLNNSIDRSNITNY